MGFPIIFLVQITYHKLTPTHSLLIALQCIRNINAHLHQAAQVIEVVDEFEQLTYVVGNRGTVGIHLSEVLFVDFTKS